MTPPYSWNATKKVGSDISQNATIGNFIKKYFWFRCLKISVFMFHKRWPLVSNSANNFFYLNESGNNLIYHIPKEHVHWIFSFYILDMRHSRTIERKNPQKIHNGPVNNYLFAKLITSVLSYCILFSRYSCENPKTFLRKGGGVQQLF